MKFRIWFRELRPEFLVLSPVLVLLGTAVSLKSGYFSLTRFFLTMVGLLLAHSSVNVLNDYFDFKSGIDSETTPTAFSGGSGILTQGLLKPRSVYIFGLATLFLAFPIGLYLSIVSGWQLLLLVFFGGFLIYLYTSFLTKWLIGELCAGLGLGALPVIGTYFIQTCSYSHEIMFVCLIPGLLTTNLLLLNEFPDLEADKRAGRYNLVIALGRKKACRLYAAILFLMYCCIIIGVILKIMPLLTIIALGTIIFAIKSVIITFRNYDDVVALIPALKFNVITVLGTDMLLALGYFLGSILK